MGKTIKYEISSFALHVMAMLFMLLDHTWATIAPTQVWMTCVGRLAYPIFAFMLVEGYFHTKNLRKYFLRMFIFALISEIPFDFMYGGSFFYPYHQNVMWTYIIAMFGIFLMEKIRSKKKIWLSILVCPLIVLLGVILGYATMVDFYGTGVATVFVFYFFREKKWWCYVGQIVGMYIINVTILGGFYYPVILFGHEFELYQQSIAMLSLLPIWLYRGKQGYHKKWFQYFCYSFYPLHITVLVVSGYLMSSESFKSSIGKILLKVDVINEAVNGFIWGVPAMICIVGVGILLSVRTRFIQVRKFGESMRSTVGKIFSKNQVKDGAMSPFQAVCTALAGTVGTGNIAGVAGAIAIGGPGAVFWMWCSAFLGMCTKFAEVTLAVKYRETNDEGELVGGPMYYIKNGLGSKWKWLAILYAVFGVFTVFGTGNATQVNTIVTSIDTALLNYNVIKEASVQNFNLIAGVVIAGLVALVLLGGIKRIGQVTEKLVPFMAVLYVLLALGVVAINFKHLPYVFEAIFAGAFSPRGFTGGVVGSMFLSLKKGVSRGIFSNEAGLGTGSIAHACADTDKPVNQGLFGIFEVFMDTIVICTLTALTILCSGINITFGEPAGAELTISGFTNTYGNWISIFTAVAMCCFAFSTIIGWGLYGSRCIEFIFGNKSVKAFLVVYSLVSIIGAAIDLGLLWGIADTFNGFMVIPNLIALFLLSGKLVHIVKEHYENKEVKE